MAATVMDSTNYGALALTMDMGLSDSPYLLTDLEEMIIEQRGLREVSLLMLIFKNFRFLFLVWIKVGEVYV